MHALSLWYISHFFLFLDFRQADVIFEYLYSHGGLHILNHSGLLESETVADVDDDDGDGDVGDEVENI